MSAALKELTEEQKGEACLLYSEGYSGTEISKIFGVTFNHVYKVLREKGVAVRPPASQVFKYPKEVEKEICREYEAGSSQTLLATKYGTNSTRIGAILKRNGVKARKAGEWSMSGVGQRYLDSQPDKNLLPSEEAVACGCFNAGWTVSAIAGYLKCSPLAVRTALLKNGITHREPVYTTHRPHQGKYGDDVGDELGTRKCVDCEKEKSLSEFHSCKRRKDGKSIRCKQCYRKWRRESARAYRPAQTKTVTEKRCPQCCLVKPVDSFHKNQKSPDGFAVWCVSCHKISSRQRYLSLKEEILKAYGGKCACCGESAVEFLAIDHVNGDGAKERRHIGSGARFYAVLKQLGFPKDGYRILCHNCNCARGYYGYCPHEKKPSV